MAKTKGRDEAAGQADKIRNVGAGVVAHLNRCIERVLGGEKPAAADSPAAELITTAASAASAAFAALEGAGDEATAITMFRDMITLIARAGAQAHVEGRHLPVVTP